MAGRLGKPVLPTDLSDFYQLLSRKLFQVMEDLEASTETRDVQKETCTLCGTLLTLLKHSQNDRESIYICGSEFEGTTTPGMQSDIDFLSVSEDNPVVVDTSSAQQYKHCLLMVQDSQIPPGYAKLQLMYYGRPIPINPIFRFFSLLHVDRDGRVFVTISSALENMELNGERHGPARTFTIPGSPITGDFVPAVRCWRWPDCATEWLTRKRRYNWPDPVLFNKCKSLGCFLVQVGHPTSDEKDLQWRLSFTLQERLLVTNFNSTQLKCYILMKFMKKEILHWILKEETISSYHCKTCMLYMIENTPANFWKEEHLLTCFYNCMKMILSWSENGVCPNYFIPDENMFDGRMSAELRIRLCSVLRMIISSNFKFLLGVKSDNLGTRLKNVCTTLNISMAYERRAGGIISSAMEYWVLVPIFTSSWKIELRTGKPLTSRSLLAIKRQLLQTEIITEHTREETQRTISLLLPYIDLALMSGLIVSAKRRRKPAAVIFDALISDKWREISSQSDPFSARLKQASYLCVLGYHSVSRDILLPLENKINPNLISVCACPVRSPSYKPPMSMTSVHSVEDMLKHHVIPCIQFLQAEKHLSPTALCYEMIRLPGETTKLARTFRSMKTDIASVDGKILLYFLLYLNHRALGMEAQAGADIANIHWVLQTDFNLHHKATAFNLLGWIYKEMGLIDKAMECFNHSLFIQPQYNAAIRHIKDIENVLRSMLYCVRL